MKSVPFPCHLLPLLLASIFMAQAASSLAQTTPPAVTNHLSESAVRLARDIATRRAKGDVFTSLKEMHQLMGQWSPVGLAQERMIELLGKPSSSTEKVMIYRFDHGEGGWQWEFEMMKGVIEKVKKVSLE